MALKTPASKEMKQRLARPGAGYQIESLGDVVAAGRASLDDQNFQMQMMPTHGGLLNQSKYTSTIQ